MAGHTEYVRTQFMNEVQDQLETTDGLTVRWPRKRFDTSANSEWLEPRDLGYTPQAISASGPKRVESWTFQINVLVDVSADGTSIYRRDELVDFVVEHFRWLELDVVNWDQSSPRDVVGTLEFLQPDTTPLAHTEADDRFEAVAITLPADFNDLEV